MAGVLQGEKRREQFRRIADEALEIVKMSSSLIDEIARALETFRLYSTDHQHANTVTRDIVSKIRALFYNRRIITIDVGRKRFLANHLPIYEVSRAGDDLHRQLLEMKVGGITFTEGAGTADISLFMRLLGEAISTKRKRDWIVEKMQAENLRHIDLEMPMIEDMAEEEGPAIGESGEDAEKSMIEAVRRGKKEDQYIEDPRKVYQVAAGMIKDIMHTPNQPDQINIRDLTKMAENIVDSLLRHPNDLVAMAIAGHIEDYQYMHPVNVAVYGAQIAIPLLRDSRRLIEFVRIALLYDVGKSHLPPTLFSKHEPYSLEEFAALHQHPVISADLLDRHTDLEKLAVVVAYEHHAGERSGGYPAVDVSLETNLITRIVAVAEAFDALITNDVYRQTIRPYQAMGKLLQEFQGTAEAALVTDLIKAVGLVPAGSVVTLSNSRVGIVASPVKGRLISPMVKILTDPSGALIKNGEIIPTGEDCRITDVIPAGKVPFDPLEYFPFQRQPKS